jgi:hypothetical protein
VSAFRRTIGPAFLGAPAPASLAANADNPRRNCGPPVHTLPLPRRSVAGFSDIHTWQAPPAAIPSARITLKEDRRDEDLRPAVALNLPAED